MDQVKGRVYFRDKEWELKVREMERRNEKGAIRRMGLNEKRRGVVFLCLCRAMVWLGAGRHSQYPNFDMSKLKIFGY